MAQPSLVIPPLSEFPRKPPGVWPAPLKWRRWKPRRFDQDAALASIPAAWREDRRTLHARCVAAMGLGAVGGVCFEQLARMGVGRLYGFDPDRYGPESWLTQPSLADQQGERKAVVQGRRAALANPWAEVATAAAFAQDAPLAVLHEADVIVLAGDNLELLVWAGEYAAGLGKVVVQGAVHGASQTVCVRGFNLADAHAICPTCLVGEQEWSHTTSRLGCDPATGRLQGRQPTQTSPHVCAAAGQLAAGEVVKWLLGQRELVLDGAEAQYNLLGHRAFRTILPPKESCRGPHRRWRVEKWRRPAREIALADLASSIAAEQDEKPIACAGGETRWLAKAELPWITRASCGNCGAVKRVRRFSRLGRKLARCRCGGAFWADLEGRRTTIPGDDLSDVWRTPLARLGLRAGDAVALCRDEHWTWFILS